MPQASPSIFNQRASERLQSPDDLDKYVRVTNPSVWVVLAACVVLLAGLLAWGLFGSVSTNVTATGVVADGRPMCFLAAEDVARVRVGDVASVGGAQMRVEEVASVPLSHDEVHELLSSDYLTAVLVGGDWTYPVSFTGDVSGLAEGVPLAVGITTERVAPISLIMGN